MARHKKTGALLGLQFKDRSRLGNCLHTMTHLARTRIDRSNKKRYGNDCALASMVLLHSGGMSRRMGEALDDDKTDFGQATCQLPFPGGEEDDVEAPPRSLPPPPSCSSPPLATEASTRTLLFELGKRMLRHERPIFTIDDEAHYASDPPTRGGPPPSPTAPSSASS